MQVRVRVRMCGNKYKEGKDEGENYCRGKKWWLLGDTREPPKKPPGIFHNELKELAGIMEAKEVKKAVRSKKVGMQTTFKLPFMHTICTHLGCLDNTDKWDMIVICYRRISESCFHIPSIPTAGFPRVGCVGCSSSSSISSPSPSSQMVQQPMVVTKGLRIP